MAVEFCIYFSLADQLSKSLTISALVIICLHNYLPIEKKAALISLITDLA